MASPRDFPEANFTFKKPEHMQNCRDLRVHNNGVTQFSCWELTWKERLSALVWGRVWLRVFSGQHPPVAMDAMRWMWKKERRRPTWIRKLVNARW
jgi:hypothetical protein